MLSPDRVQQILSLSKAGSSARAIAAHLGHNPKTVRDYLAGRRTAGVRVQQPSAFTDLIASYCRQRLAEDSHLLRSNLFKEVTEIGFTASRATFYRELTRRQLMPASHAHSPAPQGAEHESDDSPRPVGATFAQVPVLPRRVRPVAGEALLSYLTRLATANHLTLSEILAVLPGWFTTKTNNPDDRAQHHMLTPAVTDALHALAHLTDMTAAGLAHALPAFGAPHNHGPVRATTACNRCTARRGILQPVPVHLPAHHKICTRHGIWLSDAGQAHLDLTACPEILTAQHRANRLLRRHTPQQLLLAHQAAATSIPSWPTSPAAIPFHWRHRLLTLQTTNHRYGTPTDHDAYIHAAIYPDAIALAAAELNPHPAGPE